MTGGYMQLLIAHTLIDYIKINMLAHTLMINYRSTITICNFFSDFLGTFIDHMNIHDEIK
jgi:hypothetical protein